MIDHPIITKYVLHGGDTSTDSESNLGYHRQADVEGKDEIRVLLCYFNRDKKDYEKMQEAEIEKLHKAIPDKSFTTEIASEDPKTLEEQIRQSDVLYVRGGPTEPLLEIFDKINFAELIKGKIYMGSSGGAQILAKYYYYNDLERLADGLGILPVKFIPHVGSNYADTKPEEWQERIEKLESYGKPYPVIVLGETEYKAIDSIENTPLLQKVRDYINGLTGVDEEDAKHMHYERTIYWMQVLKPDADEASLIAALSHDIQRVVENGHISLNDKDSQKALRYHQEKGAEIIGDFLKSVGAKEDLIQKVKHMISRHEEGGDADQNLLKDADSLSFLETNGERFMKKFMESEGKEVVKMKFDWTYNRISSPLAKSLTKENYIRLINLLK